MDKIIMRAEIAKCLKSCASTDENRVIMQGINITPEYVESTDGRMLFRAGRGQMSTCAAIGPHKIIAINKFGGGLSEVIIEKLDGEYPNTTAIMPKESPEKDTIQLHITDDKKDITSISAAIIKLYDHTRTMKSEYVPEDLPGNGYSAHLLSRLAPLRTTWIAGKAAHDREIRLDDKYNSGADQITAVIMPFQLKD